MMLTLVKDTSIVRYIRRRECPGEWSQRGLQPEKEEDIHRSERFGSCKPLPATSWTKQALEFKVLMIVGIQTSLYNFERHVNQTNVF
jgi:hypothetical protein